MGVFAECSVFTAPLSDALFTHSASVILPSSSVLSPLPPVSFFYQLSPLYRPLRLCAALLCFPDCFISLPHTPTPLLFLFSAVSGAALLCFPSSDPTLEHLREIRRRLASETLQLKAPVPHLLSRSQFGSVKTHESEFGCVLETSR